MSQRILVVEDQEDNRRILRDLLTNAGFELIEATTGEEGVRLAVLNHPDLILMDVQMPVLDGHEVALWGTRRSRKRSAAQSIQTGAPWKPMAQINSSASCRVLMIYPRFSAATFWNFSVACELVGARYPAAPLGLITVAAMLPANWDIRLVNRNTEELTDADLAWADIVMTGGMLAQQVDTLELIALLSRARQTGRRRRAGPNVEPARLCRGGLPGARRGRRHHRRIHRRLGWPARGPGASPLRNSRST